MKPLLVLLLLLFSGLLASGQKMPSDYFQEGTAYMSNGKYDKAIAAFTYITDHHPKNELYPRAFYNIGYAYYQNKQFDSAKLVFNTILKSDFNEKEKLGGSIMADPYVNYRHRAANLLYRLYYDARVYDSSLYYLGMADSVYPYLHFCGNELEAQEVYMSLRYAEVYENLGQMQLAKGALLKSVFIGLADNTEVITKLKRLYENDADKSKLKAKLDSALNHIYYKTEQYDEYEFKSYYFKFQGVEIPIPHIYVDENDIPRKKMIAEIRETDFYKMIAQL